MEQWRQRWKWRRWLSLNSTLADMRQLGTLLIVLWAPPLRAEVLEIYVWVRYLILTIARHDDIQLYSLGM